MNNDTIPSYGVDSIKGRYNESILKNTELSMKENKVVIKKTNIKLFKVTLTITALTH